jgi:hypothetical protein
MNPIDVFGPPFEVKGFAAHWVCSGGEVFLEADFDVSERYRYAQIVQAPVEADYFLEKP